MKVIFLVIFILFFSSSLLAKSIYTDKEVLIEKKISIIVGSNISWLAGCGETKFRSKITKEIKSLSKYDYKNIQKGIAQGTGTGNKVSTGCSTENVNETKKWVNNYVNELALLVDIAVNGISDESTNKKESNNNKKVNKVSSNSGDIYDFEIEGMSVGQSALDYTSENYIKDNEYHYPNSLKFKLVENIETPSSNIYDAVDFHYKNGDSKYIIQSVQGRSTFKDNIEDCYPQMDIIIDDIKNNFNYLSFGDKEKLNHNGDSSGKSHYTSAYFEFISGYVIVQCYDYSKEYGYEDNLTVSIDTIEFDDWLVDEAYD